MIVDAVGEETVAWVRDIGYMSRVLTSCIFLAALMWGLKASAGKKFNWIWPTPYAHASREGGRDFETGSMADIRARSQAAREAFRQQIRDVPAARPRSSTQRQEEAVRRLGPGTVTPENLPPGTRFDFVYPRGTRAGQCREVTVREWSTSTSGSPMIICHERNDGSSRHYIAELMQEVRVLPKDPLTSLARQASAPRNPAEGVARWAVSQSGVCFPWLTRSEQPQGRSQPASAASGTSGSSAPPSARPKSEPRGDGPGSAVPTGTGSATAPESDVSLVFDKLPAVSFRGYPGLGAVVCRLFRQAEQAIMGTAYCFDYPDACRVLESRRRAGVQVRILLDGGQHASPSCKQQPARIAELLEWGVEFRSFSPGRGTYSVLHAKTWALDGRVYLGGSANFTSNGLEKSEEQLVIVKDENFLASYMDWFEGLWAQGKVVTAGRGTT